MRHPQPPDGMRHIGWVNTRSGSFHPLKLSVYPQEWWAPVYVSLEEFETSIERGIERRYRRAQRTGTPVPRPFLNPCPFCGHEHGVGCRIKPGPRTKKDDDATS